MSTIEVITFPQTFLIEDYEPWYYWVKSFYDYELCYKWTIAWLRAEFEIDFFPLVFYDDKSSLNIFLETGGGDGELGILLLGL